MVTADVQFLRCTDADIEAIESLAGAWLKNGQVLEWQTVATLHLTRGIALLPKSDALSASHDNSYASARRQDLLARGVSLSIELLGQVSESARPCVCHQRSSLVLFTCYLSIESPVRCGDCFGTVALYELPHTHDQEHLTLLQWAADYRACDTLQMHCTTGERFAEAQLLHHDSALSRCGRSIAARLGSLLDVPVYYFLMKARGASSAREQRRRCPACSGSWALDTQWHGRFDFRCEACRLLSNRAYSLAR